MESPDTQNADYRKRQVGNRRSKVRLTTVLFVVVFLIISYFIGRSISSQWEVIRNHPWQFHFGWLICSALLLWVVSINLIQLWRFLLFTVSGKQLRFGAAFRITVLSNLGKYLPGKVWSVLGMFYLLGREGYSTSSALACSVLHQAFTLLAGAIFITVVLGGEVFSGLPVLSLVLGSIITLLVLYPPVFSRMLNWGLRIFKREPVVVQLSLLQSLGLFIFYVLSWVMYGITFWCLLKGLGVQPGPFWETVAAFGAAYLLGFLALFAPGGLGVREGVLSVFLAGALTPGVAAVIAIAARLWMTLIETSQLIPLAIFKNLRTRSGPHDKPTNKPDG